MKIPFWSVSVLSVKDGTFTSVHIEEFEVLRPDTKLGKEEITRDIPNVGEEALKDLDECGIIRLGAEITAGDILVGKVTPKGETQLSPEEKLLRKRSAPCSYNLSCLSMKPWVGHPLVYAGIDEHMNLCSQFKLLNRSDDGGNSPCSDLLAQLIS